MCSFQDIFFCWCSTFSNLEESTSTTEKELLREGLNFAEEFQDSSLSVLDQIFRHCHLLQAYCQLLVAHRQLCHLQVIARLSISNLQNFQSTYAVIFTSDFSTSERSCKILEKQAFLLL